MIAAYRRQDWDRADQLARQCLATLEHAPAWLPTGVTLDGVYKLYLKRIADLRADPPPGDWDAVFEPGTK